MSHFTKVKTEIKSLVNLKKALDNLGLTYVEGTVAQPVTINGYEGETTEVLMEIKTGCRYSVGLIKNKDNEYELVSDWWGLETNLGVKQKDFVSGIMKQYAYNTVLDKVKEKGYSVVSEQQDSNKNIKLVVRRWV